MLLAHRSTRLLVVTALAASAGLTSGASGQVWDGGGADNLWSTANNWNPNGVPLNDGTANVGFRGSTRLTPVLNFSATVNGIGFDTPAGAFVIDDGGVFRARLTVGAGGITNHDNSLQSFLCVVELGAAQTFRAGSGPLAFGVVDGSGFQLTVDGNFDTIMSRIASFGSSLVKRGAGTLTFTSGSSYSGGTSINAGTLRASNTAGSATGSGAVTVAIGGALSGTGIVSGPVQNDGTVRPGDQTGTLTLTSSYAQGPGATLDIEIDGSGPAGYDTLSVAGSATVSGTLAVTFVNGFTPLRGDSFVVLTAGAIDGEFTSVILPPLPSPLIWQVVYAATSVRLSVTESAVIPYQGLLDHAAQPANGPHDFRFRLFDAAAGGTLIAGPQCADDVAVTDGLFTTTMDFGLQFDPTAPRFLEIEVRRDTGLGCANTTGFTPLAPRQPVTGTPRATAANIAYSLVAPDGSPADAVVVDTVGRIGIGTATPTHSVHIASTAPSLALQDTDSSGLSGGTQIGYVSFRDNANVERGWIGYGGTGDPDISVLNARPSGDIVLTPLGGGGIGIGTTAPGGKLDVRGDIRLGTSGQYLATAGDVSLRIVRGTVDDLNGGHCGAGVASPIVVGNGFSCEGAPVGDTGSYVVTFDTPFAAAPSVVGSSYWDSFFGGKYVTVYDVTPSGFKLRLFSSGADDNICRQWSFIAIGVR